MKEIIRHSPHGYKGNKPNLIVVHAMAEYLDTEADDNDPHAYEFLRKIGLSAHILIAPNGDVYRLRNDDELAFHAKNFNTNSLGIEFLVPGTHDYSTFLKAINEDWVSEDQYQSGLEVIRKWMFKFHIFKKQVKRHSDISPGRKKDPGRGFPWIRLTQDIA